MAEHTYVLVAICPFASFARAVLRWHGSMIATFFHCDSRRRYDVRVACSITSKKYGEKNIEIGEHACTVVHPCHLLSWIILNPQAGCADQPRHVTYVQTPGLTEKDC
eukprot:COSAG02_NODE_3634_length_6446_cov_3.541201_10_plen_107_part_00